MKKPIIWVANTRPNGGVYLDPRGCAVMLHEGKPVASVKVDRLLANGETFTVELPPFREE